MLGGSRSRLQSQKQVDFSNYSSYGQSKLRDSRNTHIFARGGQEENKS